MIAPAHVTTLMDYFRISHDGRKKEIINALASFDAIPNSFCAACSFQSNEFIYLSPTVEKLLGYPHAHFLAGGYDFFFKLIPDGVIPRILARQSEYNKLFSSVKFDYTRPFIVEFDGTFRKADKSLLAIKQLGVILEFDPGASARIFFAVWLSVDDPANRIRKTYILQRLKDFHRLMLGPAPAGIRPGPAKRLIKIKTPDFVAPKLTEKEKEILLLLSRGLSLKEIARKMKVSYFTSESHRKHLFGKFEVRNVAELIKKASKVYWLE